MKRVYSISLSLLLFLGFIPIVGSLEFEDSEDYDYWFYYNGIGRISNGALSNDGEYFASGGNGYLYLFHKSNWAYLWRISTTGNPQSIDISSDGSYIVSGYPSGTIYFHAKERASPLWSSVISTSTDVMVSLSENGLYVAGAAMVSPSIGDTRVRLYNYSSNIPLWSYDILSTGGGTSEIEISSDGKYIVVGAPNNHLYFFNTTFASPKVPMWSYDVGSDIFDLKISNNGQFVVVNSQLNGLFVFNTTSQTPEIPKWNFPMLNPSQHIDISSDGNYLVAGNISSFWLFNIVSPNPIWNVSMQVSALSISGDGNFIVAGNALHNISFYTKENNTALWSHDVHDTISSIKISTHGETFIVESQSLYCFYRTVRGTGYLEVDMLDQVYTKENFDITFAVKDINGEGIDTASIQMWWNGTDVSSDIQNLGLGVYRVILDPITVNPGEIPILLNMSIYAGGYNDKYYETSLAVDPALLKSDTAPSIPGYNIFLLFTLIIGITILIIYRKIHTQERKIII